MKLLKLVYSIAFGFALAPFAGAMIASVNGTAGHNTDPTKDFQGNAPSEDITEIWNRTVTFNNGTGTYLGKNAQGDYLFLTAYHVSSTQYFHSPCIVSTGETFSDLTITSTTYRLTNNDTNKTGTDLSIVVLSAENKTAEFLNSFKENIQIYTGELYDKYTVQDKTYLRNQETLYLVGTGKSLSLETGSGVTKGNREKQWAQFQADGDWIDDSGNAIFVEAFSKNDKSLQAGEQDSGSGAFIFNSKTQAWEIAGVAVNVGSNVKGASDVGYIENSTIETPKVCYTVFMDLSKYASQINAIMAIPEPSVFGLLAGIFALGFAGTRRKRK